MTSLARRRSSASAHGGTRSCERCRYPWSATTCPAAAISRASAGWRSTCSPTRKNVALRGAPRAPRGPRACRRVRAVVEGQVDRRAVAGGAPAQSEGRGTAAARCGGERGAAPPHRRPDRQPRPRARRHASILPMGTAGIAAGLACGAAAAVCFELGYVVQAGDARAAGAGGCAAAAAARAAPSVAGRLGARRVRPRSAAARRSPSRRSASCSRRSCSGSVCSSSSRSAASGSGSGAADRLAVVGRGGRGAADRARRRGGRGATAAAIPSSCLPSSPESCWSCSPPRTRPAGRVCSCSRPASARRGP